MKCKQCGLEMCSEGWLKCPKCGWRTVNAFPTPPWASESANDDVSTSGRNIFGDRKNKWEDQMNNEAIANRKVMDKCANCASAEAERDAAIREVGETARALGYAEIERDKYKALAGELAAALRAYMGNYLCCSVDARKALARAKEAGL